MNSKLNDFCRVCKKQELISILNLSQMPLTDEFISKASIGKEYLSDIEIGVCNNCGVVQNLNNTEMVEYYNDYEYSVGSSKFALSFMKRLAEKIHKNFFIESKIYKVLEIGSGSGEQLQAFNDLGCCSIGVEPSSYLTNYAQQNGIETICDFFTKDITTKLPDDFKKVDCIVSSYTFDHIQDLKETFDTVNAILNDDGVLVVEIHDLSLIVHRKEFCLFEHEHYFYLNKITAKKVFLLNGFDILTFDLLDDLYKRANSLLIVAKKSKKHDLKINVKQEVDSITNLQLNIGSIINRIDNWLLKNADKRVVAYGAGGRGVMTIAALNNYNNFEFIVDKSPKGINIVTPKTHINVYHSEILKEERVDYIFVFSFGYLDEIMNDLSSYGYMSRQFVSLLDFV